MPFPLKDENILGLVVAKRDVARRWGVTENPTVQEWTKGTDLYMAAERRTTYQSRGCPKQILQNMGSVEMTLWA